MRGINLVTDNKFELQDCREALAGSFERVDVRHNVDSARAEGLPAGAMNELVVEHQDARTYVLERPTTIREYEPEEIEALLKIVSEPKKFFAVDYTDEELLRRVLAVLLQHEGGERVVVEDDGSFALLKDFLSAGGA